jgi:hypothetical protein
MALEFVGIGDTELTNNFWDVGGFKVFMEGMVRDIPRCSSYGSKEFRLSSLDDVENFMQLAKNIAVLIGRSMSYLYVKNCYN